MESASELRVPRPRHLRSAPVPAAPPRPAPAGFSQVPARLTASCSRRPRRRRRRGGAANAGRSGDSWCRRGRPALGSGCGRWGPPVGAAGGHPTSELGRGAGRGPGRARRGSASVPAGSPARCCARCPARTRLSAPPKSRDAAAAAVEAGGRPGGRAGGGPRMGLPGRAQQPGTPPRGRAGEAAVAAALARGTGLLAGLSRPAPGKIWGRSPLQARLAMRRLARPG